MKGWQNVVSANKPVTAKFCNPFSEIQKLIFIDKK
jgi:hypothetical protein